MRSPRVACLAIAGLVGGVPSVAQEVSSATVSLTAQFATRTSLKVSSELLQFNVAQPGEPATAAIDFSAGARTRARDDIVLTIEPLHGIDGPGGAADVETALSVADVSDGVAREVTASRPTVVARWQGSGLRRGRLLFTLRANTSGLYSTPVRLVLTTP